MGTGWFSITVELLHGRGDRFWPPPDRIFAALRGHTFAMLGEAIDAAFARWDLSHLHEFRLEDGRIIGSPDGDGDVEALIDHETRLDFLKPGDRFLYVFDFGDEWTHLCAVGEETIDPLETLGIVPSRPLPYWGWGQIPDQYGRRWSDDDGESPLPPDPGPINLQSFRQGT